MGWIRRSSARTLRCHVMCAAVSASGQKNVQKCASSRMAGPLDPTPSRLGSATRSRARLYSILTLRPKSVGLQLLIGKPAGLVTTPAPQCGLKIMLLAQFESQGKREDPRVSPTKKMLPLPPLTRDHPGRLRRAKSCCRRPRCRLRSE